MSNAKTIADNQSDLARALAALRQHSAFSGELKPLLNLAPPAGYTVDVALCSATGRRIKKTAAAQNWDPKSGSVHIRFRPVEQARPQDEPITQPSSGSEGQPQHTFVFALDDAERDPQLRFIALKWFRDNFLARLAEPWVTSPESRHSAITDAIQRTWVLTSKVPNPKTPAFPVTAIRLNRSHPEVQRILRQRPAPKGEFHPIDISGEPLSQTVLKARR